MAASTHPGTKQNHPAPHRHHVGAWPMAFGLTGGALAWAAHLYVNYALASEACSPGTPGFSEGALIGLHLTMVADGAAAMIDRRTRNLGLLC